MSDDVSDPVLDATRTGLVGEAEKVEIVVVEYDPDWPRRFTIERAKIKWALGDRALAVDHIGSTSVVGLAAKPIIDICVTVTDSPTKRATCPH